MDPGRSERRGQGADHLLAGCLWRRRPLVLTDAIESSAHTNVDLSRAQHLKTEFMKLAPAAKVKGRIVRAIANQVVALLILQHPLHTAAQIIVVVNGDAAGLFRQETQTILRIQELRGA